MKPNSLSSNSESHKQSPEMIHQYDSQANLHFASYHELADVPVSFKSLEEEFASRLALVEDLHKRFHFMMTELKAAGLKAD